MYNTKIGTKWCGAQYKHGCLLYNYRRRCGIRFLKVAWEWERQTRYIPISEQSGAVQGFMTAGRCMRWREQARPAGCLLGTHTHCRDRVRMPSPPQLTEHCKRKKTH